MTRIFGLPVALLMAVTSAALSQLPRSLIGQGGFEGTLVGWEIDHGRVELDGQQAAVGTGSVRLTDSAALQTPLIPYAQQFLRVAFRLRTEGVERGKEPWNLAGVQVAWFDADRKEVGHNDVGLTGGTTDWTLHEGGSFHEAKEGMAWFQVRLMVWDTRGTAWFDDVVVEATEPPEAFRKVPLLSEVEDSVPRFWALPELQPLSGPIDVGPLVLNVATAGGPFIAPAAPGAPDVGRLDVRLSTGEPLGFGESGLEAAAGYCYRHRSVLEAASGYPALETYTEVFRGSPIVSQFFRLYLTENARLPRFEVGLEAPPGLTRLAYFVGNRLVDSALGEASPRYRLGRTTKPFLVLHAPDDSAGLVVY
ncbi:MAG: hypothetical protein FJX74_17250, partial [Armatimonadetes bacterium]|nr:hypothetical protein [Armatimonadota bacterium]